MGRPIVWDCPFVGSGVVSAFVRTHVALVRRQPGVQTAAAAATKPQSHALLRTTVPVMEGRQRVCGPINSAADALVRVCEWLLQQQQAVVVVEDGEEDDVNDDEDDGDAPVPVSRAGEGV